MKIACPSCKRLLLDVPDDFPPRPFCSPQCKLADLHHWLNEGYRIPGPRESSEAIDPDGVDQ